MLHDPHPARSALAGSIKHCSDPAVPPCAVLLSRAARGAPRASHRHGPGRHCPVPGDPARGRWEHRVWRLQNAQAGPRAALVLTEHQPWQEPGAAAAPHIPEVSTSPEPHKYRPRVVILSCTHIHPEHGQGWQGQPCSSGELPRVGAAARCESGTMEPSRSPDRAEPPPASPAALLCGVPVFPWEITAHRCLEGGEALSTLRVVQPPGFPQ